MASPSTSLNLLKREIRLLFIQPGVWSGEIFCTLSAVSLDDKPHYDALSYAWGDLKVTSPVMINNNLFEVTTTVWSALRRLRQKKETRVIWIDQICIDQGNDLEKTHQVNMMAGIYKSARHVWIWFGDEEETKERGFYERPLTVEDSQSNFKLRKVKRKALQHHWAHRLKMKPTKNRCHDWEALSLAFDFIHHVADDKHFYETPYFDQNLIETPFYQDVVRGLNMIANRTWWERVWVVQETCLALSATVILGSRVIPWSSLEQWSAHMGKHAKRTCCRGNFDSLWDDAQQAMLTISDSIQTIAFCLTDEDKLLLENLWMTREKKCKDTRDKVYSLLGLLSEGGDSHSINPDYSLPTLEVYTKVVENHIQRHTNLDFLCNFLPGSPEYPTWVPDWSVHHSRDKTHQFFYTCFNSWTGETNAIIDLDGTTFSVDAIFLDTVSWSSANSFDYKSDEIEVFQAIKEFQEALVQERNLDCEYITDGGVREAFFRTLVSDFIEGGNIRRAAPDSWMLIETWWEGCVSARKLLRASDLDNKVSLSVRYSTNSSSARFFMTEQGYIGKGPVLTSPGDQVFLLKGCKMPVILRPAEEREVTGANVNITHSGCFTFVGDCYCHGVMDGEAVERFSDRIDLVSLV